MVQLEIEDIPYATMVLHCLKYPSKGVSGLMLGTKKGEKVKVTAVVPLVHESAPLAPSLEIALALVSSRSVSPSILGVYYSNQSLRDKGINSQAARLAERIAAVTGNPSLLAQMVNWCFSPDCSTSCISAYTLDGSTWKDVNADVSTSAFSLTAQAINRKFHRELNDFENHLDRPEYDFYNSHLIKQLEQLSD